jgi:hypothetical protein
MSVLSSKDKALHCATHLLGYDVSHITMHKMAALLSQETGTSVSVYTHSGGFWSFDVVQRLLHERGMACTHIVADGKWCADSLSFLKQHSGLVGFVQVDNLESYKYVRNQWSDSKRELTFENVGARFRLASNVVLVHKMWQPLIPYFKNKHSFHVSTDVAPLERSECSPSSCWRVEPVSYEGREKAVKEQLRVTTRSGILMSSSREVLLCRPTSRGWRTKTLLNFESMPLEDSSRQVAERLADRLVSLIENEKDTRKGWSVMAHALFSAYHYLGGKMKADEYSQFTRDEIDVLTTYQNKLEGVTL